MRIQYVKDITKEVFEYIKTNSGDVTASDIWRAFGDNWQSISFALNNLETDGKVELSIRNESVGKRYYAVDERLWRIK